jgi:hypothetical protein
MPKRARKLTCEEFQRQLPELVSSDSDPSDHPHARACAVCRHLAQDLVVIADEARKLFPPQWSDLKWWPH